MPKKFQVKKVNYVPIRYIEDLNFEATVGFLDKDSELKIFVRRIEKNARKDDTIRIKSKKADQESVIDLMRILKDIIQGG